MDIGSDVPRDTVSLTYQQLADHLGIDMQSARRRVLRSKWPKTRGNDGLARVQVPATVLPTAPAVLPAGPATATVAEDNVVPIRQPVPANDPVTPEAMSHLLSQIGELATLRQRLGAAEGEAATLQEAIGHARAQAATERAARDRAEREVIAQEGREAALRAELAAERQKASEVSEVDAAVRRELDHLRIERETIRKLGFLARLAWVIRGDR
jgi:hypothetical protein